MTTAADLNARAERLLRLGLDAAAILRNDGPDAARDSLAHLDPAERDDLLFVVLGCVDISQPPHKLTYWLTGRVIPEHADEWAWDAPPLRVGVAA